MFVFVPWLCSVKVNCCILGKGERLYFVAKVNGCILCSVKATAVFYGTLRYHQVFYGVLPGFFSILPGLFSRKDTVKATAPKSTVFYGIVLYCKVFYGVLYFAGVFFPFCRVHYGIPQQAHRSFAFVQATASKSTVFYGILQQHATTGNISM